jgi:hypothetical protein
MSIRQAGRAGIGRAAPTSPTAPTAPTATTNPTTPTAPTTKTARTSRTSRRLRVAMTALVATDLVGGVLAVGSGVNTWSEAWGSKALLAAPVPMLTGQLVLTFVATRGKGRGAAVAAGVLGLACFVSVISGFFDGGIGNAELTPGLSAYQAFLLLVTGVVGALAGLRAREAAR